MSLKFSQTIVCCILALLMLSACSSFLPVIGEGNITSAHLYNGAKDTLAKSAKENFDKIDFSGSFAVESQNLDSLLQAETEAVRSVYESQTRLQLWRFASSDGHSLWKEYDDADARLKALGFTDYFTWRQSRLKLHVSDVAERSVSNRIDRLKRLLNEPDTPQALKELHKDVGCKNVEALRTKIDDHPHYSRKTRTLVIVDSLSKACSRLPDNINNPFLQRKTSDLALAFADWQKAIEDIKKDKEVSKAIASEIKVFKDANSFTKSVDTEKKKRESEESGSADTACRKSSGCGASIRGLLSEDSALSSDALSRIFGDESDTGKNINAITTILSSVVGGGVDKVCPKDGTLNDEQKKSCDNLNRAFNTLLGSNWAEFIAGDGIKAICPDALDGDPAAGSEHKVSCTELRKLTDKTSKEDAEEFVKAEHLANVCPAESQTPTNFTDIQRRSCSHLEDALDALTGKDNKEFLAFRSFSEALRNYRNAKSKAPTGALAVTLSQLTAQQNLAKAKVQLARQRANLARQRFEALRLEGDSLGDLMNAICNFAFLDSGNDHPGSSQKKDQDKCAKLFASGRKTCPDPKPKKPQTPEESACEIWAERLSDDIKDETSSEAQAVRWLLKGVAARARAERARSTAAEIEFRIADLHHKTTLATALFAIESHNNLAAGGIGQLSAYHGSGIKASQIAGLIVEAAGLAGIAIRVGD